MSRCCRKRSKWWRFNLDWMGGDVHYFEVLSAKARDPKLSPKSAQQRHRKRFFWKRYVLFLFGILQFWNMPVQPTSTQFCVSCRNHSCDLHYKSNDWLLYDMQHWAKMGWLVFQMCMFKEMLSSLPRIHSFSTYAKFSEKLAFYLLICARTYLYQGVKMLVFR